MLPFDKHTADPAALQGCGASLVDEGATALQNGSSTREAYAPAIPAVTGVCAPEIAAAQQPVDDSSDEASGQLVWASVVTQYWGTRVQAFNDRVDEITGDLDAQGPHYGAEGTGGEEPTDDQVADARAEATAQAKQQWWTAYGTYVQDGGQSTASMLEQGPTADNMALARDAGVLPPMEIDAWSTIVDGFKGMVVPPGDQGGAGLGGWGLGNLVTAGGWMRDYWTARNVAFKPRGPNGRYVKVDPWKASNGFWQRYQGYTNPKFSTPKPFQAASAARWARFGRVAGPVGAVISAGTGAVDQWSRDAGRTDISTDERVARAGYRGGLNAAGGLAGAALGAKAGAVIGSFGGPVGTAIGGVAGAIIGGVIGSGVAGAVADHTIEAATDLYEGAKDFASDVGDKAEEVWDDITPW